MRTVTFEVIGIPRPQGSIRAYTPKGWTRPILKHDNPETKGWKQLVAEQAQAVAVEVFEGPITIALRFYLPRPQSLPRKVTHHVKKPDLDKLVRCVNDALTGVLYRDDSQIVDLFAAKVYVTGLLSPRALITVTEASPAATLTATSLFPEESHAPTVP